MRPGHGLGIVIDVAMMPSSAYPVSPAWRLLMHAFGVAPGDVLRRAGLPDDLLARDGATLRADEFARLLEAFHVESGDPLLALRAGFAMSFEMFDAPVFAAMCSEHFDAAAARLARYKRLCAPVALHVDVGPTSTTIGLEWAAPPVVPPPMLYAFELACCLQLARLGTRREVVPLAVTSPHRFEPADEFTRAFGVPVTPAPVVTMTLAAADARAPFLTARAGMWSFFEPELRRRLAELDATASTSERVRSALLELLPGGRGSVHDVAARLGTSARTLQRRLQDEGQSFQRVLDATREGLARYYLGSTGLAGAEISFLLGFEDPNSFTRAFHEWTGTTPERLRTQLRAAR